MDRSAESSVLRARSQAVQEEAKQYATVYTLMHLTTQRHYSYS